MKPGALIVNNVPVSAGVTRVLSIVQLACSARAHEHMSTSDAAR